FLALAKPIRKMLKSISAKAVVYGIFHYPQAKACGNSIPTRPAPAQVHLRLARQYCCKKANILSLIFN
ncbi:MAG: hypothetical protein ABI760_06335, partial [Ferruginibacter sp.]